MPRKSHFAIQKALQGMGEPKSVKKLRSGDLLIKTKFAAQSKCYLSAKTFLDFPLQVVPHRSLNFSRGVISEPDLLSTSESEILEGFSDQSVIQPELTHINQRGGYLNFKKFTHTFQIICAVLNARSSDIRKLLAAYNWFALDGRLMGILPLTVL
ncbi:putative RNA-directed DNA polymerase from transposon BS [Trichonephila clavipes]|uniref:Putative RNA-directed DNA polymerase from transposon BS n=1 Tax=Trichonephila clavipes TaxID=2585209 RepID=A0A8X6T0N9_TRICX|nr:putative RNA-directed DNA polymerase from transposon BS [Trichonephila clavipes]